MSESELFGSAAWAGVLTETYGFTVEYQDELPFCRIDDAAGRRVIALPFTDYLPVDQADRANKFLTTLSRRYPTYRVVLKSRLPHDTSPGSDAHISKRAYCHRYRPGGGGASSSFRRGTRQAIRAGIEVRRASDEAACDRFYHLYLRQRLQKFGSIPQSPSFFQSVHRRFIGNGNGFYLEAWSSAGRHAATLVVLRCGDGWFYKFGASDPDLLADRPNNLLFDHLTAAVDDGESTFLDLGLSGSSEAYAGLRRFKSATGAEMHPLTYLTCEPPDYADDGSAEFLVGLGAVTSRLAAIGAPADTVIPVSEALYRYFA
ncbi:GNAT family N-acetyltransferase [Lewinella sp. IMCC34183]|uniref:GNAT family N-acetyltransferase n=1 Tax=Lewinella sp. IMCC34183 TaxID=2248762 RepID=UPI000E2370EF|nr:GNAT family N-acetyltransferase [Lewinella sp. IMCC34183]